MRVVCRSGLDASWDTTLVSKHHNEVMSWLWSNAYAGVDGTLSSQQSCSDALANEQEGK